MSSLKVSIGVIGAGHLGRYHIECLQRIGGFELIGFFDADPGRTKEITDKYQIRAFDSFDSILKEADALCIVTPTVFHFDLGLKAVEAGKHLFIEKPLTDKPETSRQLTELIEEKGLIGRVGHVERYNPAFVAAQKIGIRKPMFVEAHRLSQFNVRGTDVSVVMDLMIHDIDLVLHMMGHDVDHIEANGVGVAGVKADICNARITFKNGAVANLTASRISLKQMRKLRIFQPDQYMAIDFLNHEVQVVELHRQEPSDKFSMQLDLEDGPRWIAGDNPIVNKHNAIEEELKEFLAAIQGQSDTGVSFREGAKAVELAHQVMQQIGNYAM